jgi:hypothetical protein
MNKNPPKIDFDIVKIELISPSTEWKRREELLQQLVSQLPHIFQNYQLLDRLCGLSQQIALQLSDLRSVIVKLASELIQETAILSKQSRSNRVLCFIEELTKEPNFIKALGSGNKVISRHAHVALQAITTSQCLSFEALSTFYSNQRSNKIIAIRERVAETIFGFLTGILCPQKKIKSDLLSGIDDNSERMPRPISKICSVTKPDGNSNKLPDSGLYIQFSKDAADFFSKDASAGVRDFAKQIRKCIPSLEILISTGLDNRNRDKESDLSIETTEDFEQRRKVGKSVNRNQIPTSEQEIGSKLVKTELINPKVERNSRSVHKTKNEGKKPQYLTMSIDNLLKNLNDQKINVQDKVSEVNNLLIKPPKVTTDEFLELINQIEVAKNTPLRESLVRLLTSVEFLTAPNENHPEKEILIKVFDKKLNQKPFVKPLINYLVNRIGLWEVTLLFVKVGLDELAGAMCQAFDVEEFEEFVNDKSESIELLVIQITKNVANDKSFDENISLFQRLMQLKAGIHFSAGHVYEESFLLQLKKIDPSLSKFILLKQSKASKTRPPIEEKVASVEQKTEVTKIHELMSKANLVTRKNILKSIIGHVSKLSSPEVGENTRFKIAAKTLDIIGCVASEADGADSEILLLALEVSEKLVLASIEFAQLKTLFDIIKQIFEIHENKLKIAHGKKILEFISVEPRFLIELVLLSSQSNTIALRFLSFIFDNLKISKNRSEIIKECDEIIQDFIEIVKRELISNPDVQIRKLAVSTLVQLYVALGPKRAAEINDLFEPEQRTLINVYFKKAML